MDKAASAFASFIKCRCPRCRKGKIFPHFILNPLKFSKTNDYCPVCNLKFEHETGFYWSAMYISYVFSTGIMLLFGIIAINHDWSFTKIMLVIVPSIIIITPFSFRYSRVVILYLLSPHRHYNKDYNK